MLVHSGSLPLLVGFTLLLLTNAQSQAADGLIVPFASVLPACASQCGPLFDVQGACTPPNIAATSSSCFCGDSRLQPFLQSGTTGVEQVCGAASCQDSTDLDKIQNWYEGYCKDATTSNPTTTSAVATGTATHTAAPGTTTAPSSSHPDSSDGSNQSWLSTHYRWLIFIIVVVVGLGAVWIGAIYLRRHCVRKHNEQYQMRSAIAWGPHQMQGATGGVGVDANYTRSGASKEAITMARAISANPGINDPKPVRKSWFGRGI